MTDERILFWSCKPPYGFLSNFYYHPMQMGLYTAISSENFYQAAKSYHQDKEFSLKVLRAPSSREAKALASHGPVDHRWDLEIEYVTGEKWLWKDLVMLRVLEHKFSHPDLQIALWNTGTKKLAENSPYDGYWGLGPNQLGSNKLGLLLEKVRTRKRFEYPQPIQDLFVN